MKKFTLIFIVLIMVGCAARTPSTRSRAVPGLIEDIPPAIEISEESSGSQDICIQWTIIVDEGQMEYEYRCITVDQLRGILFADQDDQ